MRELFINNQVIDLFPNEHIALTKQCNKLNELKDRQADYSNQFVIPATPNNKRVCGFPNVVGTHSLNPYTKLPATYIENGSELISNGVAVIEEYRGNISVILYSGIYDFFNSIGDASLRDLPLTDADHTFNLAGVAAGNTSDKYGYPLIQWGATDKNNNIIDIRYQMPVVKVPYLVDKIFESVPYQKGGDVFQFESYENLVLPVVEDELIDTDSTLLSQSFEAHVLNNVNTRLGALGYKDYSGFQGNYYTVPFANLSTGSAYDSSAGWYNYTSNPFPSFQSRYTAGNKVTVNASVVMYLNTPYTDPGIATGARDVVCVVLRKNGNQIIGSYVRTEVHGAPINTQTLAEINVDNVNLNPGEWLDVVISTGLSRSFLGTIYETGALFGDSGFYTKFEVTAVNTRELGQNLSLNNLIPDMKQKDLLKDLMILYCLVPQYDPLTRTINFVQFDTIGENAKLAAVNTDPLGQFSSDWSEKFNEASGYKVNFRFGGYAQQNFLKWSQDDDRGEVGTGVIFIDDTTLTEKTDLFSTVFAASIQELNFKGSNTGVNIKRYTRVEADTYSNTRSYSTGDLALFNGIVYETSSDVTGASPPSSPWSPLEIQYEKTESAAPRLLLIRDYDNGGSPALSSLTLTDGTNNLVVTNHKIAYFVDPLQQYDLSFQFIISEHYETLVQVLTKTKILVAEFKLSDNDFKNIDFFKPVYIKYFGNYFYINEVTNYISGRLTSAELVRL